MTPISAPYRITKIEYTDAGERRSPAGHYETRALAERQLARNIENYKNVKGLPRHPDHYAATGEMFHPGPDFILEETPHT
jgi:hypothetical protein